MTSETEAPVDPVPGESPPHRSPKRVVVLLVVVALFAGVALAKLVAPNAKPSASSRTSLTTIHNNASADYAAARRSGRPIYILFHSLS